MRNLETVQRIYDAFGRGDLPTILATLDPAIDWEYSSSVTLPWLRRRRGPQEVAGFFGALAEGLEITRFALKEVFASPDGRVVVALIDIAATVRATGRGIEEEDEIHLWRFGDDGRVLRFRHGADTAKHVQAAA